MDIFWEFVKLGAAGLVGAYITFFFEKRKQSYASNLEEKRAVYDEFTSLIIDLFVEGKNGGKTSDEDVPLKRFYEFYKKFILFASDKSIDAFGDLIVYARTETMDHKTWITKLSKLLGYMRKDLGLSNTYLDINSTKLMRPIINEYDEIFTKTNNSKLKK